VRHEHDAPDAAGTAGRGFGRPFRWAGAVSDVENGRRNHAPHGRKKFCLADAGGGGKPERRVHESAREQGPRRAGAQEPAGGNGGAGTRRSFRPERKAPGRRGAGAADKGRAVRPGFRRHTGGTPASGGSVRGRRQPPWPEAGCARREAARPGRHSGTSAAQRRFRRHGTAAQSDRGWQRLRPDLGTGAAGAGLLSAAVFRRTSVPAGKPRCWKPHGKNSAA